MPDSVLTWLHFGDLHITEAGEHDYRDFRALIADANAHLSGAVDFAVLPGDNADDGKSWPRTRPAGAAGL